MQAAIDYLAHLPVEWFVLIAAFLEELIAPIPSFAVFVPAGASLGARGTAAWYIVVLALIAAAGRIVASLILYWLSGRLYGYAFRGGRRSWLGLKHQQLERVRARLTGRRAGWALFTMWALPIVPAMPLSLMCGFLRVPLPTFLTATFAGSIINIGSYLYVGYLGLKAVTAFRQIAAYGQIALALAVVIAAAIWWARRRDDR